MANDTSGGDLLPWQWPEERWRGAVNKVRAGRSLKPAQWKDGARCAVALSFDSDHESSTLRRGLTSPGMLSQGEYGSRVALPRILKLLAKHDVKASFFVPAVIAMLYPEEQRAVIDAGHEIGIHGWIHESNSELPAADERELQMRAADVLEKICGVRPVGIRTPSWDFSPRTLAISREMGLLYDSSLMADDDPYELLEDGEATGMIELPVEWIRDDYVYFGMDRTSAIRPHMAPSAVLEIYEQEFEGAYEEGGLFILTMHPHVSGHHSRIRMVDQFITRLRARDDVWFATHAEVAQYCLDNAG
jgi:peptidoglycan/xylan/chitin deacetylase (PgdA/CDA1 family)